MEIHGSGNRIRIRIKEPFDFRDFSMFQSQITPKKCVQIYFRLNRLENWKTTFDLGANQPQPH